MGTLKAFQTTPAHEYAQIFALHEGPPLWELSDRIKVNGLRDPIVTLDGKILDGRRREIACFRAAIEPRYRKFGSRKEDGDDPLEFVIDLNLHRRHLGEGERDLAAARYATARDGNPRGTNQHTAKEEPAPKAQVPPEGTNSSAAAKFKTSEARVRRAKKVIAKGTPALQGAVKDDVVAVTDAANVADQPPEVQDAAVDAVRTGKAKTLTAAVREPGDDLDADETIEQEIGRVNREIESFCRKVTELVKECPEDHWLTDMNRRGGALLKFKHACEALRTGKCAGSCPRCLGKGKDADGSKCGPCHGTGRMPKLNLDACK